MPRPTQSSDSISTPSKTVAIVSKPPRTDLPPLRPDLETFIAMDTKFDDILQTSTLATIAPELHDDLKPHARLLGRLSYLAVCIASGCSHTSVVQEHSPHLQDFVPASSIRGTANPNSSIKMTGDGIFGGQVLTLDNTWVSVGHPCSVAATGELGRDLISPASFVTQMGRTESA